MLDLGRSAAHGPAHSNGTASDAARLHRDTVLDLSRDLHSICASPHRVTRKELKKRDTSRSHCAQSR
jgi:hypothetical protein